jgi:hypothetical protein
MIHKLYATLATVLPQPLVQNYFTISKIPFSPQNVLATQTVEKIKKIQANVS